MFKLATGAWTLIMAFSGKETRSWVKAVPTGKAKEGLAVAPWVGGR
jgi:hypothetical protein